MSTFLVTLTVVVLSVVGAVAVAVRDPAQPAMLRTIKRRERPRPVRQASPLSRRPRTPARAIAAVRRVPPSRRDVLTQASRPVTVPATVEITGFTDQWTSGPTGPKLSVRLRSGVVLTLLLAVLGTLVAAGVAGVIVLLALAVRSAVS